MLTWIDIYKTFLHICMSENVATYILTAAFSPNKDLLKKSFTKIISKKYKLSHAWNKVR